MLLKDEKPRVDENMEKIRTQRIQNLMKKTLEKKITNPSKPYIHAYHESIHKQFCKTFNQAFLKQVENRNFKVSRIPKNGISSSIQSRSQYKQLLGQSIESDLKQKISELKNIFFDQQKPIMKKRDFYSQIKESNQVKISPQKLNFQSNIKQKDDEQNYVPEKQKIFTKKEQKQIKILQIQKQQNKQKIQIKNIQIIKQKKVQILINSDKILEQKKQIIIKQQDINKIDQFNKQPQKSEKQNQPARLEQKSNSENIQNQQVLSKKIQIVQKQQKEQIRQKQKEQEQKGLLDFKEQKIKQKEQQNFKKEESESEYQVEEDDQPNYYSQINQQQAQKSNNKQSLDLITVQNISASKQIHSKSQQKQIHHQFQQQVQLTKLIQNSSEKVNQELKITQQQMAKIEQNNIFENQQNINFNQNNIIIEHPIPLQSIILQDTVQQESTKCAQILPNHSQNQNILCTQMKIAQEADSISGLLDKTQPQKSRVLELLDELFRQFIQQIQNQPIKCQSCHRKNQQLKKLAAQNQILALQLAEIKAENEKIIEKAKRAAISFKLQQSELQRQIKKLNQKLNEQFYMVGPGIKNNKRKKSQSHQAEQKMQIKKNYNSEQQSLKNDSELDQNESNSQKNSSDQG